MRRRSSLLLPLLLLALTTACGLTGGDDIDGGGVGACVRTSECNEGTVCIAGACGQPGSSGAGRRCSATRDCQAGLYCSLGQICLAPSNEGRLNDACVTDDNCTVGLRCLYAGFGGTCVQAGQTDLGDGCTATSECLAGLYCGQQSECQIYATAFTKFTGPMCTDDADFKAYFEVPRPTKAPVDFFRVPYPNDVRVTVAGNRKVVDMSDFPRPGLSQLGADLVDLYVDAFVEDFDGWGTQIPIFFRFSGTFDFEFLKSVAGDAIRIIDTTSNAQVFGFSYERADNKTLYACANMVTIFPTFSEQPYRLGHTYIAIIKRSGIKQTNGTLVAQAPDMTAVLAAAKPGDGGAMDHAWEAYAPVRAYLTAQSIPAADVATATVFTVADPTAHMAKLAAAVKALPAPEITSLFQCGTSTGTDPCDDGTEARKCGAPDDAFYEIHGKMKMPLFQMGTAPYDKASDGGGLNESGGAVTKTADADVCFALTIPKTAAPFNGWPLVVYGHGTGGSFRSFIADGLAKQMATAGTKAAMLGFDQVGHGARRGASKKTPDNLVFNVLNPRAARDNFQQGGADILTALKVTAATFPSGIAVPIKFAGKPLYFGHSQGSTHGELALAFSDDAPAIVLSGAGASLAASLQTKSSPFSIPDGLERLIGERVDHAHPMLAIWSNYFDRADPAAYAKLLIKEPPAGLHPKHVFMSFGTGDTYSPQYTLESNAIYLGTPAVAPVLYQGEIAGPVNRPVSKNVNGVTAGTFQYAPSGYDGHFVAWRNADGLKDVTAFITSFFASGTPTVP